MNAYKRPETIKELTGDVAEMSRDFWLAGLGAVATVEEEGTKMYETLRESGNTRLTSLQKEATTFFDNRVTRGAAFEQKGRKQVEVVKEGVETAREDFTERRQAFARKLEQTVTGSVEAALEKLEVPTRTEVRTLTQQVERLTRQVRQLAASLEK